MTEDEKKIKHLEMLQAVISRLAGNSFTLKGWNITLVSALFAFAAKDANPRYAGLALLPALCFWGLDAYYLRQERLFRKLYDGIRVETPTAAEVAAGKGQAKSAVVSFSMNTSPVTNTVQSWFRTLFTRTVFALHAPILLAVVGVTAYALTR